MTHKPILEKWLIFDAHPERSEGGQTYHYGGGDWGENKKRAEEYESKAEATQKIADLDPEEILRDRLVPVSVWRLQ